MTTFWEPGRPRRRVGLLAVVAACVAAGAGQGRRAAPPSFGPAELAVFASDARAWLVGPRPDFARRPPPAGRSARSASDEPGGPPAGAQRWSALISAETLETEVKRQASVVAGLVTSATGFKGGGYRDARDAFGTLALMFAIAAEHDGQPRWRDRAGGLAAAFGRAGANCKVGTDGSFREARARSEDLAELIRGGRPALPGPPPDLAWGDLAGRSLVMRRMERAHRQRLAPALAGERALARHAGEVAHEAQVLAALAEAITRGGFPDGDDDGYAALARALRDASKDVASAADHDDYGAARRGMEQVTKSCSDCHDLYRG